MKKILLGAALLSICSAYAGDLKAPFSLPSARVLPKGVRNLSYKGLMVTAENKFNAEGTSLVLADPFFKNIRSYRSRILDSSNVVSRSR